MTRRAVTNLVNSMELTFVDNFLCLQSSNYLPSLSDSANSDAKRIKGIKMSEAIWKKEQDTRPQLTPSWALYAEAANNFRSSAEAFMEYVHILNEARSSYQQAMSASTELRNRLDASDQTLTSLMTKLEQVVNNHFFEPAPDRKKPELVKGDSARAKDEDTDIGRKFP
jgi:hypothetical protein